MKSDFLVDAAIKWQAKDKRLFSSSYPPDKGRIVLVKHLSKLLGIPSSCVPENHHFKAATMLLYNQSVYNQHHYNQIQDFWMKPTQFWVSQRNIWTWWLSNWYCWCLKVSWHLAWLQRPLLKTKKSFIVINVYLHTLLNWCWVNDSNPPIFDYEKIICKSASQTLLHKLDVIYHAAIHFVARCLILTHHCVLNSLTNWPSLHSCRQFYLQISHGQNPVIFAVSS